MALQPQVYHLVRTADGSWILDPKSATPSTGGDLSSTSATPTARPVRSATSAPAARVQPVQSGPAPKPASTDTATGEQRAAIEGTIQRGNDARSRAFATGDPTVMQDTATSEWYQALARSYEQSRVRGVTAIQMGRIDWLSIMVDGSTAGVRTFEVWTNTAKGVTQGSSGNHFYTLVLQTEGAWKIKSIE